MVISPARLDDPRSTERLVRVMLKDRSPIVRVYAWEALHARQDRLTPQQRGLWVKTAFDLAEKNYLWGDLRIGVELWPSKARRRRPWTRRTLNAISAPRRRPLP